MKEVRKNKTMIEDCKEKGMFLTQQLTEIGNQEFDKQEDMRELTRLKKQKKNNKLDDNQEQLFNELSLKQETLETPGRNRSTDLTLSNGLQQRIGKN